MSDSFDCEFAKRDLREFLKRQSLPSDISWVFVEDIAWVNMRLKIRSPLPVDNEVAVCTAIESSKARKIGIELRAVAKTAQTTLCAVIFPADEREAEESRIHGLKLSALESMPEAFEVGGFFEWMYARMRHREPSPIDGLLSYRELQRLLKAGNGRG